MGNPGPVEDILSDEYEEGEIRDDDILFENVSSLEEISDQEYPEIKPSKEDRKSRSRRKKEHKCKEDSLCRKERTGKYCYARIRKFSANSPKSSATAGPVESVKRRDEKNIGKFDGASATRGNLRSGVFSKAVVDVRKSNPRRKQTAYYARKEPARSLKKISGNRRTRKQSVTPLGDRDYHRKRRSWSVSPISNSKAKYDSNRAVAKSSLLDRLVGSGSIPLKSQINCDSDTDSRFNNSGEDDVMKRNHLVFSLENKSCCSGQNVQEIDTQGMDARFLMENISPADIPVPPTPKSISPLQEPQKEDIDEVELRVYALKTAIMKKYSDLKRKKNLARTSKVRPIDKYEDSFTELALMNIENSFGNGESSATPPHSGIEDIVMDVSSERDSQESPTWVKNADAQEELSNDVLIAPDMSKIADRSPSRNKLPCCSGKPIPVVSLHRPAKDSERGRPALNPGNVVSIPCTMEISPPIRPQVETPKYLKEINSNQKGSVKKKWSATRGTAKRQNQVRRRTLAIPRRIDRSLSREVKQKRVRLENEEDEDELRKLALMSVKRKNSISEGMLARVDVTPLVVQTDSTLLNEMKEPSMKSQPQDETWENLDEDILRAQLLSSLSQKIPPGPPNLVDNNSIFPSRDPVPNRRLVRKVSAVRKQVITKKLNKENVYTQRNLSLHSSKASRNLKKYINPNAKVVSTVNSMNPPVVDKFIIRVGDSESSEDEPIVNNAIISSTPVQCELPHLEKSDIELRIDHLLETTRRETELIQEASMFYPPYDVPPEALPPAEIKQENTCGESCERLSEEKDEEIFGLTAWQQKEFERQKKATASKLTVIKTAKKKIKIKNAEKMKLSSGGRKKIAEVTESDIISIDRSSMLGAVPERTVETILIPSDSSDDKKFAIAPNEETSSPFREIHVITNSNENLKSHDCSSVQMAVQNETPDAFDENPTSSETTVSNCKDLDEINAILTELVNRVSSECDLNKSEQKSLVNADPPLSGHPPNNLSVATEETLCFKSETSSVSDEIQTTISREPKTDIGRSQVPVHMEVTVQPKENSNPGMPADGRSTDTTVENVTPSAKNGVLLGQKSLLSKVQPSGLPRIPINQPEARKTTTFSDSSFVQKAIDGLVSLVDRFENDVAEYKNGRRECAILRRQLLLAQQKQAKKRKELLEMKKAIETKKTFLQPIVMMDMSSLSPLPDTKDNLKQPKRTAEFIKLKVKEVCLRAHLATMGLEGDLKRPPAIVRTVADEPPCSPRKRMKLKKTVPVGATPTITTSNTLSLKKPPVASTSGKLVVSVRDKDQMDPLIPLCPYDRRGVCMDEECKYQHLRP